MALASCSPPPPPKRPMPVAPQPRPDPRPAPRPLPAPQPQINWRDAPLTPGTWRWAMEGNRSVARFADSQLALVCDRAAGTVTLLRQGSGADHVPVTVLTGTQVRPISGTPLAGEPPCVGAVLNPRDNLLDAMALSRGRFSVEVAGLPTLYVPSWSEVTRVVEDCR